MLATGRGHAQVVLTRVTDLLKDLGPSGLRNTSSSFPASPLIWICYRATRSLALRAAEAHVTLFVVQVDESSFDVSDRTHAATISGHTYTGGLATIAASTGGSFYSAVGRAASSTGLLPTSITITSSGSSRVRRTRTGRHIELR